MHKAFIKENNQTTLACPACERSRTIDAGPYISLSRVVRFKIKCPCGYQFMTELERRRHFRKTVSFPGTYARTTGGGFAEEGSMAVLDLSRNGVKLRLGQHNSLRIGDKLRVEFKLDDPKRSKIRQEGVVRRIDGSDMGAEFATTDPNDPSARAIGFYLFAA